MSSEAYLVSQVYDGAKMALNKGMGHALLLAGHLLPSVSLPCRDLDRPLPDLQDLHVARGTSCRDITLF